jgi:hypothetical protein
LAACPGRPIFIRQTAYAIFTANKLGFSNFELFLVDSAGRREPVRVTHTDGFDGLPAFSPEAKRLCWTSGRTPDGKSQLFLADWNHTVALEALNSAPAAERASTLARNPVRKIDAATKPKTDCRLPNRQIFLGDSDGRLARPGGLSGIRQTRRPPDRKQGKPIGG